MADRQGAASRGGPSPGGAAAEVQQGFFNRAPKAFQQLRWEIERLARESACLQRVSSILGGEGNLAEILLNVTPLIEAVWQYPKITRVRIVLDGQVHAAEPFEPTDRRLASDIIIAGDKRGQLEIYYIPEPPDIDREPFTSKQRKLAGSLAGMIAQAAEKKFIAEALAFQSNMIDQTIEGVMALDLEGNILLANQAMAAMHGYEPDELIGDHYSVLHTPDQMAYMEAVSHELLRAGQFVGEFGHVKRDGSTFPAMMHMALLRDDNGVAVGVIKTCLDITERKKAEAMEDLARSTAENPNPVLRVRADGHVLYANPAAAAMVPDGTDLVLSEVFPEWLPVLAKTLASGCQEEIEEQLGHRTLSFVFAPVAEGGYVNIYGRDITDHELAKLNQIFLDSMPCVALLLRLSTREIVACNETARQAGCAVGHTCYGTWPKFDSPCPWCKAPKAWTTGQPQRHEVEALGVVWDIHWIPLAGDLYLQCAFDITDRKRTEEELHAERRHLRALANELSLAEERERQRLSAALHDDVSQELAAAKIGIGLLGRTMKDSKHAEALDDIFQTIDQALRHVTSLTFQLCPPVLYRRGLAAALEWLVGNFAREHEASFEFVGDGMSLRLTDELRGLVFQVVRELLTNVVKHAQATKVVVTAKATEHELTVMVVDDGVGFDPALIARSRDDIGGFGLFSIRQRISHFGGQLSIEPVGRRGSMITITIPIGNED